MHEGTQKMHLDLFKPKVEAMTMESLDCGRDSEVKGDEEDCRHTENSMQKYESPKFFVGSGSPVGGSKRK